VAGALPARRDVLDLGQADLHAADRLAVRVHR